MRDRTTPNAARHKSRALLDPFVWALASSAAVCKRWKMSVTTAALSGELPGSTVAVPAVKPGDALFVRADVRFSHEYVTPMAEALFSMGLGAEAAIKDPESVFAFRDHLTFLDQIMPEAHVKMGLREQAASLATVQEKFTKEQGVKLYGEVHRKGKLVGSEGTFC